MGRVARLVPVVAVLAALTGCVGAEKSSNPLSPTVAGPIPGVNITPPNPMQPNGTRIAVDQQPVTLTVNNASTSGVRPLDYLFEIATDVNFTNKVFTLDGIAPGGGGSTALRLPDPLATGHTYYWHARAEDGANTGPFSNPASFDVFTPIVIQAPALVSPIGNATTTNLTPQFVLTDATHTGPVGAITYTLEVSTSAAFAGDIGVWTIPETPTQTSLASPVNLPAGTQIFWHARASDPTTTGPFSATAVFQTPAPAVTGGGGGSSSGGGGGSSGGGSPIAPDQLNLSLATVYNSPGDIASWAVTTKITSLVSSGCNQGISLAFSAQQSWPDYTPPGFEGALQYTVWAVVNVNGQWNTSGFVQMWNGRPGTGSPILPLSCGFPVNWAYDARWGPMNGYQPQAGEQMGFFVSAGNARGEGNVTSVRERSNVVVIGVPAGNASFSW